MKIKQTERYTLITNSHKTVNQFFEEFQSEYPAFKEEHLILDISENINTKVDEILLFLKIAVSHKKNGTSFVLICEGIDIDEIPDELSVVPTLTEAEDVLEIDEIERDLGF